MASSSADAVASILGASTLKDLAGATNALVRHSGVDNVVYVVGAESKREFDAFPAGSDWAPVSSAKPLKLPSTVPPALVSLPDSRPPPCTGGATELDGAASVVSTTGYSAEEDEEERRRRMAVRIQRAWRSWWDAETVRRACWRLRLLCGAR